VHSSSQAMMYSVYEFNLAHSEHKDTTDQ